MQEVIEKKPRLDLVGRDGNAFLILARALGVARDHGWTQEKKNEYKEKATSGDYDNLLFVTCQYFDVH